MPQTGCARPAWNGLRRVVLSVIMSALSMLGAHLLGGDTYLLHIWQSVSSAASADLESGPGEAVPPAAPLRPGDMAPDFALRDLDGKQVRLSDYRGRMPVVIEFGSISCPIATGRAADLDTLAHHYQGKIAFLFVYSNEAHPGHGQTISSSYGTFRALPQVRDYAERCEHAELFRDTVRTSRRILVDADGAESVAARYGIRGFGLVMVDAQGRIHEGGPGLRLAGELHELLGDAAGAGDLPPDAHTPPATPY
jgi:hypothetical protein